MATQHSRCPLIDPFCIGWGHPSRDVVAAFVASWLSADGEDAGRDWRRSARFRGAGRFGAGEPGAGKALPGSIVPGRILGGVVWVAWLVSPAPVGWSQNIGPSAGSVCGQPGQHR